VATWCSANNYDGNCLNINDIYMRVPNLPSQIYQIYSQALTVFHKDVTIVMYIPAPNYKTQKLSPNHA